MENTYADNTLQEEGMATAMQIIKATDSTIQEKMDSLFYLRSLDTPEAALRIQQCLSHTSVLQDHEVAYILGQMKQPNSVDFLIKTAGDATIDDIVRHEAIEALGNFEDSSLISRLAPFLNSEADIVRESAVLAIRKLGEATVDKAPIGMFGTRDPAFPLEGTFKEAAEKFSSGSLVEKYQALFYLRDLNTKEAVDVLAGGFSDPSDLLRHEIAYVFGQMENEHACDALIAVLENQNEKDIVRHEAAEALGNIGNAHCLRVLKRYINSDNVILKESARVGLGMSNAEIKIDDQ